ncbi:mucin-2 [Streptomyces sp. NPDC016675]|uniref:mucin-2 n=1 Tax=Streptomyces sp. NPDC016675 TaxID=3364970 RepID=UPI0036FA4B57
MSWFKVDDTAHSHPKVMKAGNAALGLWLKTGSYAAQHLTDGIVPGIVAQAYGTAPQARKLITVGLWHPAGHSCPRCAQPPAGDYVIHDFHVYNPTRAAEQDRRQAAADRQKRAREKAAETRKRTESPTNRPRFEDEPETKKTESPPNHIEFPDLFAGQEGPSQRDGMHPSRSPRPDPTRSTSYGGTNPPPPHVNQDRPGTPGRAEQMLATWWLQYGRTTAQSRTSVGRAIADALGNGLDPETLATALDRLGENRKPVTGGTLQFALSEARKQPGADVIPLDPTAPRRGRVAQSTDHLAAALARMEAQQ